MQIINSQRHSISLEEVLDSNYYDKIVVYKQKTANNSNYAILKYDGSMYGFQPIKGLGVELLYRSESAKDTILSAMRDREVHIFNNMKEFVQFLKNREG